MPEISVGDKAPDFVGESTHGRRSLSEYRGRNVILYFYPRDQTPGCTMESCSLRDGADQIKAYDAGVLGVSTDDVDSHKRFASMHNLNFPLIADPDFSICRRYGVLNEERKVARRVTFVIDKEGIVRHIFPKVDINVHASEVMNVLKSLNA
jgi:peroxiredoxin Q/BCP